MAVTKKIEHWNFKESKWDSEKEYQDGNLEDYLPKIPDLAKTIKSAMSRLKNTA